MAVSTRNWSLMFLAVVGRLPLRETPRAVHEIGCFFG